MVQDRGQIRSLSADQGATRSRGLRFELEYDALITSTIYNDQHYGAVGARQDSSTFLSFHACRWSNQGLLVSHWKRFTLCARPTSPFDRAARD